MTKITVSICRVVKNSGSLRFHRKNTRKHWKHYFLETENWKFGTEWINSVKAKLLKLKKRHQIQYLCVKCGCRFLALVKNKTQEVDCPNGCDSENS